MADYNYVNSTGTIVPDTEVILTQVEDEYKSVFGSDLITTPDTPQGVLIVAETLARAGVITNNALVANQINPNLSGGVFLDAICALTGLQREAETHSSVTVTVTGVAGTIIPIGSTAQTVDGDVFQAAESITLDVSGNGSGLFEAVEVGPIPAEPNTLTQIVNGVLGWETVTNALAAVLGTATQSDQSLKLLRKETLALQGQALPLAITSALSDIPGFGSLSFRENVTSSPIMIDGITLVPHSIFVCVDGCTDLEVATTILAKKSVGCDYNGNTSVPVVEPVSGQTYDVLFQRPDVVNVIMRVTVKQNSSISDISAVVKNAILAYVNGELVEEAGFAVNVDVSAFELAGAVNIAAPQLFVTNLEISLASPISYSNDTIPILINEIAATTEAGITVVITP